MPENTFDIASKIDMTEVMNAVQQTSKELLTLLLASSDEYKLKAVTEILGQKLVKRNAA